MSLGHAEVIAISGRFRNRACLSPNVYTNLLFLVSLNYTVTDGSIRDGLLCA